MMMTSGDVYANPDANRSQEIIVINSQNEKFI